MDSNQRRKSGINLPATMSETTLRLQTLSSPAGPSLRSVSSLPSPLTMSPRTISNLSSPSKSVNCSDRFIPGRSSSRLDTFGLNEKSSSPVKEGGGASNEAYLRLLKTELFGTDFGSFPSSPAGNGSSPLSPNKNMLNFKTQISSKSPFSPSVLGQENWISGGILTPPKPTRKVPKTPLKVWTHQHFKMIST